MRSSVARGSDSGASSVADRPNRCASRYLTVVRGGASLPRSNHRARVNTPTGMAKTTTIWHERLGRSGVRKSVGNQVPVQLRPWREHRHSRPSACTLCDPGRWSFTRPLAVDSPSLSFLPTGQGSEPRIPRQVHRGVKTRIPRTEARVTWPTAVTFQD